MNPSPARVQTIFSAVQWILLTVLGLLAVAGVVKALRHRHEVVLALNGGDWIDNGWYFLSMGAAGAGVLAVVLGFALVQWRRGANYLAPIALLIGTAAADLAFEDLGLAAGKLFDRPDKMQFLLTHDWRQAAAGLAITALCLFGAGYFSRRTKLSQAAGD